MINPHSVLCLLQSLWASETGPSATFWGAHKLEEMDLINAFIIQQIVTEWQLCARHYQREMWAPCTYNKIQISCQGLNDLALANLANAAHLWVLKQKWPGQMIPLHPVMANCFSYCRPIYRFLGDVSPDKLTIFLLQHWVYYLLNSHHNM